MAAKVNLEFKSLSPSNDSVAFLTLNRPGASNALDGEMIREITESLAQVKQRGLSCRALVLQGEGKNFCAGADLEWMERSKELGLAANRKEADELSCLFRALYELETPSLAMVHGAVYGGGVGLVACCDYVLAAETTKFCLSEVRVGLAASVILPFLHLKMHAGFLRRYVLSATVFDAEEARHAGLIALVVDEDQRGQTLTAEINALLSGEPTVQRIFKRNHRLLLEQDAGWLKRQCELGAATIAAARVSATGQEGFRAFFEKRKPNWAVKIS